MRLSAAVLTTASLLASPVLAEEPCCRDNANPRWYAGFSGSLVMLRDTDIKNTSAVPGFVNPDSISFDPGFGVSGALGYRILSGVRGELEVAYRANEVDKDPNASNIIPSGSISQQKSVALMGNVYVDMHNDSPYTPYIGAGVGAVHVKSPRYYVITSGPSIVENLRLKEWTLGYQFMLGVNYEVRMGLTPFEINLGYRYFTGQDAETKFKTDGAKVEFPNDSHNLELGARMYF
jgi:opacity protein-like surface antigen